MGKLSRVMRTGWGERGSVRSCLFADAAAVAGASLSPSPAALFSCELVRQAVLKSSACSMKKRPVCMAAMR
ncbi:hypothetical protein [Kamptonema formosum]|uniref:hypothetical protein n=1 Tax=Kamptonema formosum TaxID=331992 RepID=UPI00350F0354